MRGADRWQDSLRNVRNVRLSSSISLSHIILLAILAVAFGFYARTIGYWFFFDDFWFLRASQSTPFGSYALNAFNYRQPGPIVPEFLYRPLNLVTFWCSYQIFGLHAWPYHLLNIAFHLACGVLLWQIAIKITRRAIVAHLTTLIFLLHPTYATAVAWVANGNVIISTFFCLLGLWLFLLYLDGGARRRVCYVASLLVFIAALLLHPETAYLAALLVLSFVLLRATALAELRSARAWAQFVPFVLVDIGFLITQAQVREQNALQSAWFKLGPHMLGNYARYTALALNPYRTRLYIFSPDVQPLSDWHTVLPVGGGIAAAAALLFFERRRPAAGTFALLWFILAIMPSTTWTAGAFARKLYVAGPALALTVAIFAVSAWDFLPSRLQAGLRYLVPVHFLFLLVAVSMGIRVLQMTGPFGDAAGGYQTLVEEVRREYPTIPEGSRLYLAGAPWPMVIFGADSQGLASAMRLYYGDIEIIAVSSPEELAQLPEPPTPKDVVFIYHCPPVCQPPLGYLPPDQLAAPRRFPNAGT